jgi:hypothetical protein
VIFFKGELRGCAPNHDPVRAKPMRYRMPQIGSSKGFTNCLQNASQEPLNAFCAGGVRLWITVRNANRSYSGGLIFMESLEHTAMIIGT